MIDWTPRRQDAKKGKGTFKAARVDPGIRAVEPMRARADLCFLGFLASWRPIHVFCLPGL
jgi:hypothetical protein